MADDLYRHEFKYLISEGQLLLLKSRLSGYMSIDPHAAKNGVYHIRSLYFDDYRNSCLSDNLAGVDPREKFRIRIYNNDPRRISLECKRKEHGMTQKSSCLLSREQYDRILTGDLSSPSEKISPLLRKLELQMRTRLLHPVVIVEYDRIPFVYPSGNVRITLDTNLASSVRIDRFFSDPLPCRPVMPIGQQLLEVKYDSFIPDPIYRAAQLNGLQRIAFSKYTLCRQFPYTIGENQL